MKKHLKSVLCLAILISSCQKKQERRPVLKANGDNKCVIWKTTPFVLHQYNKQVQAYFDNDLAGKEVEFDLIFDMRWGMVSREILINQFHVEQGFVLMKTQDGSIRIEPDQRVESKSKESENKEKFRGFRSPFMICYCYQEYVKETKEYIHKPIIRLRFSKSPELIHHLNYEVNRIGSKSTCVCVKLKYYFSPDFKGRIKCWDLNSHEETPFFKL